jgi:hypothetical protein
MLDAWPLGWREISPIYYVREKPTSQKLVMSRQGVLSDDVVLQPTT